MTSFRETIEELMKRLDSYEGEIALPYYIPTKNNVTVFDLDTNLEEPLKKWPNCKAILGPDGDAFRMTGKYDTIYAMGPVFYFPKKNWPAFLKQMYGCLNSGGTFYLNFILAFDEQGKEEDGSTSFPEDTFKNAIGWNMAVVHGLNKEPKFNSCFVTRGELREMAEDAGFVIEQIYSGTLHIHALAILKRI